MEEYEMSIKIENEVFYSPEQLEFIIQGMRNAFNSWDKSDSERCEYKDNCDGCLRKIECDNHYISKKELILGPNDVNLMKKLAKAGTDHRKFMRMMPVYVRITAPLYWYKEFDTYKVGTVANSCSTMHKIQEKEFTIEDFSCEHLNRIGTFTLWETIDSLNIARNLYLEGGEYKGEYYKAKDKQVWWQMIQLLPSSYNQTRNVMLNYEVLANIYHSRKNHKLDEWKQFCKWIEEKVPYSWLITEIDKEGYKIIADNKVYVKC